MRPTAMVPAGRMAWADLVHGAFPKTVRRDGASPAGHRHGRRVLLSRSNPKTRAGRLLQSAGAPSASAKRTLTVRPPPAVSDSATVAPCTRAISRTMARPSPLPSWAWAVLPR